MDYTVACVGSATEGSCVRCREAINGLVSHHTHILGALRFLRMNNQLVCHDTTRLSTGTNQNPKSVESMCRGISHSSRNRIRAANACCIR